MSGVSPGAAVGVAGIRGIVVVGEGGGVGGTLLGGITDAASTAGVDGVVEDSPAMRIAMEVTVMLAIPASNPLATRLDCAVIGIPVARSG
ncbi:hypothetical protein [Pseudonocardia sp. GCM10023141]|uniref:hypothetical protein n=1 Tax=Pseudonocardia sp. GCM10023141 TaxID=3252653 RepID=UPI00360CFFC6